MVPVSVVQPAPAITQARGISLSPTPSRVIPECLLAYSLLFLSETRHDQLFFPHPHNVVYRAEWAHSKFFFASPAFASVVFVAPHAVESDTPPPLYAPADLFFSSAALTKSFSRPLLFRNCTNFLFHRSWMIFSGPAYLLSENSWSGRFSPFRPAVVRCIMIIRIPNSSGLCGAPAPPIKGACFVWLQDALLFPNDRVYFWCCNFPWWTSIFVSPRRH